MTEKTTSTSLKRFLHFIGWPAVAGILLAVVIFQYQQIERLAGASGRDASSLDESELNTTENGLQVPAISPSYSYAEAVQRAAPSVISIHSTIRQQLQLPPPEDIPPAFRNWLQSIPSERSWNSLGSGVAVSDQGHILTALHVIQGADNIEVRFQEGSGKTVITEATVIGTDQNTDLALLKVESESLPPPIPIGSSGEIKVGDAVLAIGYPSHELISQKSVSQGIVSALGIPQNGLPVVDYIQTDAAINYGNSGGALIDAHGNLIGINSFIYSQSGGSDGIGFAVPVNKAMFVMEQLVEYGEVTPGYLGVITGELLTEESSREFFGHPDIEGLLVEQVNAASPAEEAGIRPGDVMVEIDGQNINSVISAIDQINRKNPGETTDLLIYRAGEYQTITVTLGTGTAQYLEARTREADAAD